MRIKSIFHSFVDKARFVEMFGNPVSNQMEWETISWKDTFDTKTGKVDSNAAVEGGNFHSLHALKNG